MSKIQAGTTLLTGLVNTSDTTGNLQLVADSGIIDASGTIGALNIPVGTTAQRPASPVAGAIRFNSTTSVFEVYTSATIGWVTVASGAGYNAEIVLVAGGGSGSGYAAGGAGGGAGGLVYYAAQALIPYTTYTVTIGAGASGGVTGDGATGSNSTFTGLTTALGGGAGKLSGGGNGGSGGGSGSASAGGSGTSGQGNNGGTGITVSGQYNVGAGGGGAGAVGGNGTTSGTAGNGGVGVSYSTSGTATYYAGGGGGGTDNRSPSPVNGTGGLGGGGNGTNATTGSAGSGTANTGGGGGGCGYNNGTSGSGGSGVCIIKIPTSNYSGTTTGSPTVTTSGSYTILKFTSSGSYTA